MLPPIQLGQSNFTRLRRDGGLYVDKTGFVSTVLKNPALVQLYPRPRRFGKTLNLSTLQTFLEIGPDKSDIFEGLNVWNDPFARPHFQKYPVIALSFKDIKARSWEEALASIQFLLTLEIGRLQAYWSKASPLLQSKLSAQLEHPTRELLEILSLALFQATGQPVVLVVDEYDTPLLTAWEQGYFEDAVSWFRAFLSAGLKDNPHLFRGVLTGVLRVGRESLFSGLNNVIVFSLLQQDVPEPFGFTEAEVASLLNQADRSAELPNFQRWYNGYRFGNTTVFNPWSILNALFRPHAALQPWWVNTAENTLLRNLLLGSTQLQSDFATLLEGGSVEKEVEENVVLRDISSEKLWSFLLFSGYLRADQQRRDERGRQWAILTIPNLEVRTVWESTFQGWLSAGLGSLDPLHHALLTGDAPAVEELLSTLLLRQTQDEAFYHAFVLGLLVSLEKSHRVQSNREVGRGRADVQLAPKIPQQAGVILEFKKQEKRRTLVAMAEEALKQTETLAYTTELKSIGANPIYRFGIAFAGKKIAVRAA